MNPTHPPLLATLRSFPGSVWVLYAGTFLNRFGTFVVPFLALYLTKRGFSTAQAGVALGAYGCGHLGAALLGGHLADTFGRRKTIMLSMFASAVTMLLFSQANSYWAILLLAPLAGLTTETYRPAAGALLTDLVDQSNRVTAFAGYRIAINAGWAIGPAIGGFLAKHSYTWLFVGDAVTSILFGLIAWFALPAGLRLSAAQKVSFRLSVQTIARDVRFLRVLVASFLVGVIFMQTTTTFGLQIKNGGYSEAVFGAMLSLNGIMIILFELPLTLWTRRFPAVGMIATGYFLCGIGFALNILGNNITIYVVSVVVFTIGEMISLPIWSAYVADLAPTSMRGRYMGANGLTWALSLIVGPTAGMALFALHPNALWVASGLCGALATVILLKKEAPTPLVGNVADSTTA